MAVLISREAILKHIEKMRQSALMMDDIRRAGIIMNGTYLCEEVVEKVVRNQSSAQPGRKRGKWEIYVISMLDGEGCRCSECGFEGTPYWDYCPNCGSYNGEENENVEIH